MRRLSRTLVGGLAIVSTWAGSGCERDRALNVPAPDFTLQDLDGQEVSLSEFRGRPVLLSFWAVG